MKNYIGLACTVHDPAIAIVGSQGQVLFAEAAERYLQHKRAFYAPPDDLVRISKLLEEYCEPGAELVLAHSWLLRRWKGVGFRTVYNLTEKKISPLLRPTMLGQMNSFDLVGLNLAYRQHEADPKRPLPEKRYYDHHLTHASAAAYASPFQEAVCAIIDGHGEKTPESYFHYVNGGFKALRPVRVRNFAKNGSLGVFYGALCVACGFDPMKGEEWKVMGLAPYGQKDPKLYAWMRDLLRVDGTRVEGNNWQIVEKLSALRPPPDRPGIESRDVAFTGQLVFSEVAAELLQNLYKLGLSENLVLSGGCALNSAFNGKIVRQTSWKKVFVFCAPADDGNALGAALLAHREDHPKTPPPARVLTPYLGSRLDKGQLARVQELGHLRSSRPKDMPVARYAAKLLAAGKILGWAQGRAEFGPRALGNRSIVADPRSPDIKEIINARVKFREEFRPFAPSILAEHAADWFEDYQDTPYMERALMFRAEKRPLVPGVVHVDGTGRLQTVHRELNPRYHELISEFHALTGVPIVLNTSFNVMGKPIVHSVEDAIAVFYTSGIDALVLEDDVYEKPAA